MIDLSNNPNIQLEDLLRVDDLALIYEGQSVDADGEIGYWFTVAGTLDGAPIHAQVRELSNAVRTLGATVGGDAIVTHGKNFKEAEAIALMGLQDTMVIQGNEAVRRLVDGKKSAGIIASVDLVSRRDH